MKQLFKSFNKKLLKQDFRQLGINLLTASIVGGLITHATKMTLFAMALISWVGIIGLTLVLLGINKVEN